AADSPSGPSGHLSMHEEEVVLSPDEGTTGATAIAVGIDGEVRGKGYEEIAQHYPRPGWVEHDATDIWSAVQTSVRQALDAAGAKPSDVRAVGITNQRETLVLWDKETMQPISRAIVWQDRRTADECTRLRAGTSRPRILMRFSASRPRSLASRATSRRRCSVRPARRTAWPRTRMARARSS